MKVLVLSDLTGGPGGVYNHIVMLDKYLSGRLELLFLLESETEEYVDQYYQLSGLVYGPLSHRFHDERTILDNLKMLIDHFSPDIIHVMNGSIRSNLMIRKYLSNISIPFVVTEHLVDVSTEVTEEMMSIIKDLNKKTQRVIYVSRESEQIARRYFGIDARQSTVIPNGVDINLRKRDYSLGPRKFFTTARCVNQKGIDITLKAMALIKDRSLTFHVFGDGPQKSEYTNLAKKLFGDKHEFKILGWQKELNYEKIIDTYDFFVSSSRSEGLSYSQLEAAALGFPMICSRAPGNEFLLNKCKNGYLFDVEDFQGLAFQMKKYFNNPKFLNNAAKQSEKEFKESFSIERGIIKLLSVYESVKK